MISRPPGLAPSGLLWRAGSRGRYPGRAAAAQPHAGSGQGMWLDAPGPCDSFAGCQRRPEALSPTGDSVQRLKG